MKVYFTASVTGGSDRKVYAKIISTIEKLGHIVLSKHILSLSGPESLTPKEIFQREKKKVDLSDCVIAEVTKPSMGAASFLTYALTQSKLVLALFNEESGGKPPAMIEGNPAENLYVEYYNSDDLLIVLRKFFSHVSKSRFRSGKLIVIDGGDGSGKSTQAGLLMEYLKKRGFRVKLFDFPRYYSSFHGKMVGRFLAGEFGDLNSVSPYLASLAYALDRAGAKEEMDEWLGTGGIIVANRYVTSNLAHQSAKFPSGKSRDEFMEWVDELEYRVHRMPRENIVIYLFVPWKIGTELTKNKEDRAYLKGKKEDIAEADLHHRIESEKMYLWLANKKNNWIKVNCIDKYGKLRDREDIHKEILLILEEKEIIPKSKEESGGKPKKKGKGVLRVITGPMYSGKTKKLIHMARVFQQKERGFLIVKPLLDSRYTYEKVIISNDKDEWEAVVIDHLDPGQIITAVSSYPFEIAEVIIDEIQFFHRDRILGVVEKLIGQGINVTVSGLDRDYLKRPFGATLDLLTQADEKIVLTAVCEKCGGKAIFSERVAGSVSTVEVGEKDKYIAVCKKCHKVYEEKSSGDK